MALVYESKWRDLLVGEKFDEFCALAAEEAPDLENADLRGLDLVGADMDGASIHEARIGGVRFPRNIAADEISLSHRLGTRMRAR